MNVFLLSSHIFIHPWPFCLDVTWCPSATSMYLSVSSNVPGMKSETSGVIWHVAPKSKTQFVNCELSPYFTLLLYSSLDIPAIDAYILWSSLSSPLSHARSPFSLKRTCFRRFRYLFFWLGAFCNHVIFRSTSKAFLRRTFRISVRWNIHRASFLLLLSYAFETFFRRMIVTSTKCALCLKIVCSLTMSTRTWATAVKI